MKLLTFRGGIHPDDKKKATKDIPIKPLPPCEEYTFPLGQNGGAPCIPLVKKGDYVFYGQKIGDSENFVSAPLHSSVSGTVVDIAPRLTPKGVVQNSIIIQNDFKDKLWPEILPTNNDTIPQRDEIIKRVREAGIIGLGGAGFPTHVKLNPPPGNKIDTIVVNGAECEPYLTSDYRVMLESPDYVLFGLQVLMKAFNIQNGIVAIENNKPAAIENMQKHLKPNMRVVPLKTKYPQGSEKQLIWAITKREVPSGGLPANVGVLVFNIDTCTAVARAIKRKMPVTRRIITVSGGAVKTPANFLTRIGTPIRFVFEQAGGFVTHPKRVVMGGPMMGTALFDLDVPVIKTTSGLIALTEEEMGANDCDPCLRCGKCVEACPMNLSPVDLNRYALAEDWDMCEKYGVMNCMECGTCAYLCPSNRQPVQAIRKAKQAIMARRKK